MPRPNILIFMPDQQRADCIGCFGNPLIQTPNIDALAARGTKFENAYVNHPVCSPSRVNLMTGWYPHTQGHRSLAHLVQMHEPNMLKYLKQGGYNVAWAGARGDVFAPGVTEESTHFSGFTTRPEKLGMGPQYAEETALYNAFYHGQRQGSDTWIDFDTAAIRTAQDWLESNPGGPWCLWIPLIFPHLPFEVEDPWYSMYTPNDVHKRYQEFGQAKPKFHEAIRNKYGTNRLTEAQWQEIIRVYYGMISRVDHQLGQIMQTLDQSGQMDNTVTMYFTDHGEYAGDFGLVEKWPSGMDRCLLQNPLIMAGPGIKAGETASTFTEMIDILPTVLDLAEIDANHTHFGQSLVPVLHDSSIRIRDCAFSEGGFLSTDVHLFESPKGEYSNKGELQTEQPEVVGKTISMRTDEYTYVYRLYEGDELYDRITDPQERTNLIDDADLASTCAALKEKMFQWLNETSDVFPWHEDPRFPKVPHGQHDTFISADNSS